MSLLLSVLEHISSVLDAKDNKAWM